MRRIAQFVVLGTVIGVVLSLIFVWMPWFPEESSEQAGNNYPLFIAITYISFVILGVVMVAIAYSLWKFRQRGPSDLRDGDPTHGNTLLEIVWTAVPVVIVAILGAWGAIVLDRNEARADNTRSVTVIAYSFGFDYRYETDGRFTRRDGLYLPVGEKVALHMVTPLFVPGSDQRREVIHSFFVPEWQVKQDATPGVAGATVGTTWVTPTKTGTFEVQCAELCGAGHATMAFRHIRVLSKPDFAKWLATAKREAAQEIEEAKAKPGLAAFRDSGCGGCHTFAPAGTSGSTGPALDELDDSFQKAKADGDTQASDLAEFVRESIVKPNSHVAEGYSPGIMPTTYADSLGDEQIDKLTEFLAKDGAGP